MEAPLVFNAQISSKAADLFYTYDALGHFQYTQNNAESLTKEELDQRFIHYNALGAAIRSQKRCVVLIDEIDKALCDLPNDILYALENLQFRVKETGKQYKTQTENRPIIILTRNSEKNLPDAFLRRVLYYHIPFPTAEDIRYILKGHDYDIMALAFSPDSKYLLSGSGDKKTVLWNVSTGKPLSRLDGHRDYAGVVQFSPNGEYMLTADKAGIVRIWPFGE